MLHEGGKPPPSEYVTVVGEHLMSALAHLEPFLTSTGVVDAAAVRVDAAGRSTDGAEWTRLGDLLALTPTPHVVQSLAKVWSFFGFGCGFGFEFEFEFEGAERERERKKLRTARCASSRVCPLRGFLSWRIIYISAYAASRL